MPTDPTAYYNDFWLYSSYYGESAARTYYGAWSPPVGTPAPAHLAGSATQAADQAVDVVSMSAAASAPVTVPVVSGSSSGSEGAVKSETAEGSATEVATDATEGVTTGPSSSNEEEVVLADPEVRIAHLQL